tara:strand:- start:9 stop:344 length:336 start_codon:yes stop_codon:yes gene_type:complete
MSDKLFKVYLCYHHEQERNPNQYKEYVGITTTDRLGKILDLYGELFDIMNETGLETESNLVANWEGLNHDALLVDTKTGEKFWYVNQYNENYEVVGYELFGVTASADENGM